MVIGSDHSGNHENSGDRFMAFKPTGVPTGLCYALLRLPVDLCLEELKRAQRDFASACATEKHQADIIMCLGDAEFDQAGEIGVENFWPREL